MLKRCFLIPLILMIILFPISALCADDDESYVYRSATEYDYPPFSVTSEGKPDGFSVELLKAVADVMDLKITFKIDDWVTLKEELKTGELDVLPLVGYTEERDEVYDFTVPYITMHGNIFIRDNETQIQTEQDLFGKEIIVMEGDTAHEYAVNMGFTEKLILTRTYQEAFELLASGKHDAVLAQSLVGEQLIQQLDLKNIRAATQLNEVIRVETRTNLAGFEQKFCFAVKEGDSELLARLNEGLAIVSQNGTFSQLYNKWFPFMVDRAPSSTDILIASLVIILPILLLAIIIIIVIGKRTIKQKTLQLEKSNKAILEMEAHLKTQQKLEAIGVLSSGVAHEINNPINGILNYGQIILDIAENKNIDCNENREAVLGFSKEIIRESDRITSIVNQLLQFSRSDEKAYIKIDAERIIKDIQSLVSSIIKHDQIKLIIEIEPNLPKIECISQEIQQVLMNMIINAKDALNEKYESFDDNKAITIRVNKSLIQEKEYIRFSVRDNGNGIPSSIKDSIFDPFYTTKSRAEGTGLGLYISYGIVKEHNGTLKIDTKEGEYTEFIVCLPVNHDFKKAI